MTHTISAQKGAAHSLEMPRRHHNATRFEQVTDLPALLLYSLAPLAEVRQSEYRLSSHLLNQNALQAPWPAASFG